MHLTSGKSAKQNEYWYLLIIDKLYHFAWIIVLFYQLGNSDHLYFLLNTKPDSCNFYIFYFDSLYIKIILIGISQKYA